MKEQSKNFVRGENAEKVEMLKDRVLVRTIRIEPKKKTNIIMPNKEAEKDLYDIKDYQGFHPGVVEVINANSPLAKESGIEDGDIIAIPIRVFNLMMSGQADTLLVDDEILYALHVNDFICKMNYYRENFKNGKVIKKS